MLGSLDVDCLDVKNDHTKKKNDHTNVYGK